MGEWRREPLVHFLVLGLALSAGNLLLAGPRADSVPSGTAPERRIVVSESDIGRLESAWEARWSRAPTDVELESLIDGYIREEVLFRSAKELGLDDSDTVVRRRLIEQVQLLAAASGGDVEPTRSELRQRFDADPTRFAQPATRSFTHIFFDPQVRGDEAWGDAEALLGELGAMDPAPPRAPELGDRFPMQSDYPRRSRPEVARHLGEAFAERLFQIEGDGWQGPLRSEYGVHLVRIEERNDLVQRSFEEAEDIVLDDLVTERRERAAEEFYTQLRSKFEVVRGEKV